MGDTVDGRNPANQLIGSCFPLFTGFYTSQVVQDVCHQQYYIVANPNAVMHYVYIFNLFEFI